MMKSIIIVTLIFVLGVSCKQKGKIKKAPLNSSVEMPFNLRSPLKKYVLPESLYEISGIAVVSDSIIACIADEKGIVYLYNLNSGLIDNKIKFSNKGDFEDIAVIKDTIFVLESGGTIWTIENYRKHPEIGSFILTIEPPFELEGLCNRKDTLFVTAKYYHNKKGHDTGNMPVWRFTGRLIKEKPLFYLPGTVQPTRSPVTAFHTSAITFDESLQQWFCISTREKVFIQCAYEGDILNIQTLPSSVFSQPEGICFTTSGHLLIANEGKDGVANILLFNRLKQ